jgi:hypothetical protein
MVLLETEERKEAPSSVEGVSIVGGSCTVSRNSDPSPSELSSGVGFVKLVAMILWVSLARLQPSPPLRRIRPGSSRWRSEKTAVKLDSES